MYSTDNYLCNTYMIFMQLKFYLELAPQQWYHDRLKYWCKAFFSLHNTEVLWLAKVKVIHLLDFFFTPYKDLYLNQSVSRYFQNLISRNCCNITFPNTLVNILENKLPKKELLNIEDINERMLHIIREL